MSTISFSHQPRFSFSSATQQKSQTIESGDKLHLYIRFTDGAEIIFHTEEVSDLQTLIHTAREVSPSKRGLARLCVRNASKGWSMEKSMMIR